MEGMQRNFAVSTGTFFFVVDLEEMDRVPMICLRKLVQ